MAPSVTRAEPALIEVWGTTFQNPILLAAGTAGFGREISGIVDLEKLGGLVTKAVSPHARHGNPAPRVAEFNGGMLNSVGLANPGVDSVQKEMLPWLAAHLGQARVLVNVVGDTVDDYIVVVRRLATESVVTGFELNVSCPNTDRGGEEFGADPKVLADLVTGCVAETEKPVIVKLAPTLGDMAATASVAAEAGASGVSVINTIPGLGLRISRSRDDVKSSLGADRGGVSGPGLLPVGLLATRRVREATGLPVIGVGGVRTYDDVLRYLASGATLVAVGTSALADPRCPERLAAQWNRSAARGP